MRLAFPVSVASVFCLASWCNAQPDEPLLTKLPPGIFVTESFKVDAVELKKFEQKLGAGLQRLTNSKLNVHGAPIQVNVIAARDKAGAKAIQETLSKPAPFCLRKDDLVIEYVVMDPGLATKTSYELGFIDKPDRVRYRVIAELATIDKADYMSCNPLFQQFLVLGKGGEAVEEFTDLRGKFEFGRSLLLRNPNLAGEPAAYRFEPAATSTEDRGATVSYAFDQLLNRHEVPYVTAILNVTVNDSGLVKSLKAPSPVLTAATEFWPADDEHFISLAQQITRGKSSNGAKAMAILKWLQPNKNVKYTGQTGSRWGTNQVFTQKFGHCWDFSDCFVTLCRAAGVPARQVAGWLYGSSGHVWAEFYREGKGWQQVDPTGGGVMLCGIYHIPYFTTEDGHMPIVYLSLPKIEAIPATAE